MIYLILYPILLMIAAISNSVMDTLQFRFDTSIFKDTKWWNPELSWTNKWKKDEEGNLIPFRYTQYTIRLFFWTCNIKLGVWYYAFRYFPPYKERFAYSSTIFVFIIDGWHFFQEVMFTCFQVMYLLPVLFLKDTWVFFNGMVAIQNYWLFLGLFFASKFLFGQTFDSGFNRWLQKN